MEYVLIEYNDSDEVVGCYGLFEHPAEAELFARDELGLLDEDNHHDYNIFEFTRTASPTDDSAGKGASETHS